MSLSAWRVDRAAGTSADFGAWPAVIASPRRGRLRPSPYERCVMALCVEGLGPNARSCR